jgi:hypothetical protein
LAEYSAVKPQQTAIAVSWQKSRPFFRERCSKNAIMPLPSIGGAG